MSVRHQHLFQKRLYFFYGVRHFDVDAKNNLFTKVVNPFAKKYNGNDFTHNMKAVLKYKIIMLFLLFTFFFPPTMSLRIFLLPENSGLARRQINSPLLKVASQYKIPYPFNNQVFVNLVYVGKKYSFTKNICQSLISSDKIFVTTKKFASFNRRIFHR